MSDQPVPVTVVETPEFLAVTDTCMKAEERATLIDYLALHPSEGDLIPGTGGVRKLRWSLGGRSKRSATCVVYFCQVARLPLFALTAHQRSMRADLGDEDRRELKRLMSQLAAHGAEVID